MVDDEIDAEEEQVATDFNANLVDFISDSDLSKLASDVINSIKADKESRSEWEKTYTDGLKYLGMKFDESRSQPFEGSTGVIHPILAISVSKSFSSARCCCLASNCWFSESIVFSFSISSCCRI